VVCVTVDALVALSDRLNATVAVVVRVSNGVTVPDGDPVPEPDATLVGLIDCVMDRTAVLVVLTVGETVTTTLDEIVPLLDSTCVMESLDDFATEYVRVRLPLPVRDTPEDGVHELVVLAEEDLLFDPDSVCECCGDSLAEGVRDRLWLGVSHTVGDCVRDSVKLGELDPLCDTDPDRESLGDIVSECVVVRLGLGVSVTVGDSVRESVAISE